MDYRTFSYNVRIRVEFTRLEIDTITKCALSHHEIKCRAAAEPKGFIFGIQNGLLMDDLASESRYDPNLKFVTILGLDELNVLYRIMEINKKRWSSIFNELSGLKVVLEMEQKRLDRVAKEQEETEELIEA